MKPEELREFKRRQPFVPDRIHVTDGQTYDIRHPDQALILRSRIIVGVDAESGIADRVEHVALVHIVRIEELQSESVA